MKKYFLISDIHGEITALNGGLNISGYDADNENHWLVSLGDLFDRGNDNIKVFEFFKNTPRKMMILGNHDQFLLEFLSGITIDFSWNSKNNGFWETIREFADLEKYSSWMEWVGKEMLLVSKINRRFPDLLPFLESMHDAIKIDNNILTHGGFKYDPIRETWVTYNFTDTLNFIKKTAWKFPKLTFIFGHYNAISLYKGILNKNVYNKKFEFANYIGIDAASNFTLTTFVHIIESDYIPIKLNGTLNIEFIRDYDILENF